MRAFRLSDPNETQAPEERYALVALVWVAWCFLLYASVPIALLLWWMLKR